MSKTKTNSNETETPQQSFEKAESVRWEGRLYCMGCGVYVGENIPLRDLEFEPFDFMCLRCYDKTQKLKEAEWSVDELIKSIASWD